VAGGAAPEGARPDARAEKGGETRPGEPASAGREEPKKKKGFWSRIFGVFKGGDDDKADKKDPKKDEKKKDDKKDQKGDGAGGQRDKDQLGEKGGAGDRR